MAKTKAEDLFAKFEAIDQNRKTDDTEKNIANKKDEVTDSTEAVSVENDEIEPVHKEPKAQSINMSDIKIIPSEKTKKIMRSATLSPKAVENWEKAAKLYSVSKNSFLNQLLEGLFE